MRLVRRIGGLLLLCGAIAGCNSPPDSPIERDASAATTHSSIASSVYEPCSDIDDETLRSAGFNPATRRSLDPGGDETSKCAFRSGEIDLTVAASTMSFEDYRDRNAGMREGMDINDRPTVIVRRPGQDEPCELGMKTSDGIVLLTTKVPVGARVWGMDRCARIVDIATAIEPTIGTR